MSAFAVRLSLCAVGFTLLTGSTTADQTRDDSLVGITVTFGPDPNVGVWVPLEMRERHDNSWGETTTGHAQYGRYRRFLTTARLVRPGP